MIKELVVATQNLGKLEEFKVLMKDLPIEVKCLADYDPVEAPEENGRTFASNARFKATYYAKKLGVPCIADDSGLEVQALDGAPGVRSARYAGEKATDEENNEKLWHIMKFQVNALAVSVAHWLWLCLMAKCFTKLTVFAKECCSTLL